MMKKRLLFCCSIVSALTSTATQLTPEKALCNALAESHCSTHQSQVLSKDINLRSKVNVVAERKKSGITTMYLINYDGHGYAVAAESASPSSLFVKFDHEIDSNYGVAPFLEDILQAYDDEIIACAKLSRPVLKSGGRRMLGNPYENWHDIPPMIPTHWNQNAPYNNMCPIVSNTKSDGTTETRRARAGCGAIALAQVLKFHKMPTSFCDTATAIVDSQPVVMSLKNKDFSKSWHSMKDSYDTNAQDVDSVADFVNTCAFAIGSDFKWEKTSSSLGAIKQALIEKCGFNKYMTVLMKGDVATTDDFVWNKILYDELNAKRPVIYKGTFIKTNGDVRSHGFIIDGCEINLSSNACLWHINWGLKPENDCYVKLDSLTPTGRNRNYRMDQHALIGIQVQNDERFNEYITPIDEFDGDGWTDIENYRPDDQFAELSPNTQIQDVLTGKTYSYGSAPNGVYTTTSGERHFKVVKQ